MDTSAGSWMHFDYDGTYSGLLDDVQTPLELLLVLIYVLATHQDFERDFAIL